MIKEYNNRSLSVWRIVTLILCVPTVAVMFLDWISIVFLDKLSSSFKILNFIDSKFTLIDIVDLMKKFDGFFGDNIKKIVITIGVFGVLAILSIIILFISILFTNPKFIKKCSIISLIMTSSMFGIFMYCLNMINTKGAEKGEKFANMVEPTAWPYVMLVLSVLIVLITFIKIGKETSKVPERKNKKGSSK